MTNEINDPYMLADDDAQAADVFDAHADLLSPAFLAPLRRIAVDIRMFDFAAALAALRIATTTPA